MPSDQPAPQPRPASDAPSGAPGRDDARRPALRAVLVVGVLVTAVSGLALIGVLASYFAGAAPAFLPALYALSLFGLPLGFTLMVLYVVLSAVRRSRA